MTDFNRLKSEIMQSGMTMTAVANKAGIERATLYNRMRGIGEFTASEIVGLTKALRLPVSVRDSIFFSQKVD